MNRPLRALVVAVAGVGVAVAGVAGCNATRRELTVVFAPTATAQQQAAALQTCTGSAPHTSPEPQPTNPRFARGQVRFRIDAADDHDIAQLESCLQRQPGVVGFQDSNDST